MFYFSFENMNKHIFPVVEVSKLLLGWQSFRLQDKLSLTSTMASTGQASWQNPQ